MMQTDFNLEQAKKDIPPMHQTNQSIIEAQRTSLQKGVFVFISIDLVESTKKKSTESSWADLTLNFYEVSINLFDKINMLFWKTIGDEILFYRPVDSLEMLIDVPLSILKTTQYIEELLREKGYEDCEAKTTLFMAEADITDNISRKTSNYRINRYGTLDFIGIDIDEGFRLAKLAMPNILTIDAKTAYILWEYSYNEEKHIQKLAGHLPVKKYKEHIKDQYKIILTEKNQLKDIWGGKPYPVVIFHQDFLSEPFKYDEESSIYLKYKQGKASNIDNIKKIINDAHLSRKCESIADTIKLDGAKIYAPQVPSLELHTSVICIDNSDTENLKFFMVQRGEKRDVLPGRWEFGCVKANTKQHLKDSIYEQYKKTYSMDLDIIKWWNHLDVIGTYEIKKSHQYHKGLFCVALAKENEQSPEFFVRRNYYQEWGWYTEEEAQNHFKYNVDRRKMDNKNGIALSKEDDFTYLYEKIFKLALCEYHKQYGSEEK